MYKLIRAFIKKELVQALRDPRMKFMLFVTPIIQMAIFGLALENQIKNVKLYARPMANDPLFTDIKRDLLASKWFIRKSSNDAIAATDISKFINGSMDVALYAPEGGVTQAFERGEGRIEAVIDGADLIRARGINSYLGNIINETVATRLGHPESFDFAREADTNKEQSARLPIEFATRVLYNPELVTSYNLVPGVLCMLMTITTIMLTSMSIAKEKEIGTFETLIAAPVRVSEIILGKTIPYLIIGLTNLPLIFFVAVVCFQVPMRGSYIWLVTASFFFLVTTVSIGTLISTICRNQQQAMMGGFIFLMPAILLSGIMFPVDNMPHILRVVAAFNPCMYFYMLLRNIMLKGGDHMILITYTGALFAIAAVCVGIAFKRFKLHLG